MSPVRDERGLALLSALLSVALLTLIVVEMTDLTFVHSHLTRNAGNVVAAQLLARSGQVGATEALEEARGGNEPIQTLIDTLVDAAPLSLPTAQGHVIQIALQDESGRLNLNDVSKYPDAFRNLFAQLNLDPGLLEAVAARVLPDDGTLRDTRDDCALAVPCDPPHEELRSLDDLRTIRGFTSEVIAQIRPYVSANRSRKGRDRLNLRTARPELLQAIGCEDVPSLPPPPRSSDDIAAWLGGSPCPAAKPTPQDFRGDVYSITTIATVGDATQAVEATVELGRGVLAWKQRPVWGVGPGAVR